MSFTAELKTRLANKRSNKGCCFDAELMALIWMDGSIHLFNKKLSLETITENAAVARKVKQDFENKGLSVELTIRRSNLQKHSNYMVRAAGGSLIKILQEFGIVNQKGVPNLDVSLKELKPCCQKSFIKGLFLGGGYVSNPEKGYRLQLITGNFNLAKEVVRFLKENGFKVNLTETKKDFHININNSQGVLKFLVWIGASDVALEIENVQIIKDMKNYANRLVNSDTANMKRTAVAAMDQIKIIEYIRKKINIEDLPDALAEAAHLRVSYPLLPLEDLGKKNSPSLSKSAINHRLRRLKAIAKKLGY